MPKPNKLPIYLDYNATTPVDARVFEAMKPYFTEIFGNSASRSHQFGWQAEEAVEIAREKVGAIISASANEIFFTSGATEADNLAIKGIAEMYRQKGNHIITSSAEHKAVIDPCKYLQQHGFEITYLKCDSEGIITAQQVAEAITDKTILVSLIAANNETGVLLPITDIGKITRQKGVLFHTDATQAVGKIPIDVQAMNIDLLSMSAHKIYGPKGAGALFARRRSPRVRLACQMHGGGHERGMRSGTMNVPGIVGMGMACELAASELSDEAARLKQLRDRLETGMAKNISHIYVNGHPTKRLPGTSNISFAFVEGEAMMMKLRNIAVSSGSACTSESLEPSHVLKAMNVPAELAHSSIRFSLGKYTTADDIDYAIAEVTRAVDELRQLSPLYEMAMQGINIGEIKWTKG